MLAHRTAATAEQCYLAIAYTGEFQPQGERGMTMVHQSGCTDGMAAECIAYHRPLPHPRCLVSGREDEKVYLERTEQDPSAGLSLPPRQAHGSLYNTFSSCCSPKCQK